LDEAIERLPKNPEVYPWIAGFIEADGCFSISKSGGRGYREFKDRFGISIKVVQKDIRVLMLLRESFCGLIRPVSRPGPGRTRRKYLEWSVFANEAYATITLIRPYLRFKAQQADLLMTLQTNVNAWRGRYGRAGRIPEEVRKLRNELYEKCRYYNSKEYIEETNSASGEFGEHLREETIPSQAVVGKGSTEGVTATGVSPNNNPPQERPTSDTLLDEIA
jgi:hypothetical protein